jgi:membrane protease YdiL (CAAX protease family)
MPPTPEQERFPSATGAVGVLVALLMLELLLSQVFPADGSRFGLDEMGASALVMVLANGIVFTALLHRKGLGYRELFHAGRGSPQATVLVTALPVLLLVPGLILGLTLLESGLTSLLPLSAEELEMFQQMQATHFAALITTCILAPVLEEMLFRGLILRSFLARYPRGPALLGSALLFGVAHLNIYQGLVGLILGLLAGWLYERTRSLGPCILLHGAYNSSLAWLASQGLEEADAGATDAPIAVLVLAVLALAAFALGLRLLRRLLVPTGSRW